MPKNVQKRKPHPKRSIVTPGEDHELGLWIDYELLRKKENRTPMTVLHDALPETNHRYLELADLALGAKKSKKKAKAAGAE